MKILTLLCCLVFSFFSCKKKKVQAEAQRQYDVFLIAGQSNTLNGIGLIPEIDSFSAGIFQLGRYQTNNFKLLDATDPLEHWDKRAGKIGFGLTFAKFYKDSFLNPSRHILLIPCGKGSSGFISNDWNKGNPYYEDAVNRVNYVMTHYPCSEFKAILWHQGEHDVNNINFQKQLDQMVLDLRMDIDDWQSPQIFILGGMVPYWVAKDSIRARQQHLMSTIADRLPYTGFADPTSPFIISKPDNEMDQNHYDAEGQRELGRRYFREYVKLRK